MIIFDIILPIILKSLCSRQNKFKKKTIINTGDDINDTTFRVYHYDTSSTLTFNNKIYSINYTNHSTSTDVIVTESIQKYLGIYNTQEYTPTENYHPSTKKYVDDKIKDELGDEELTTVNKDVKGAINEVNAQYKEMASKQEVNVERKRIDAFVKLAEGSTTGDAELVDGRIGADGITYNNIGEAIRGQMGKKVTGVGITKIMTITQEDYDYSTKDPNTLYIISDTTGESGTTQQLIPYLKNTGGNSYIDTGYVPKLNSKFELTIRDESLVSNNAYFGNQYFNMYYAGTNWAAALHGNEYAGVQLTNPSSKHTYIRNSTELYVDGQLQSTVNDGTKVDTRSLYIFGKHLADGYSTMSSKFAFFELKIYEDDTLVHHYKPKKDSSDVAGLYDIVTQQYLYNSGTGTLEYGTELEEE